MPAGKEGIGRLADALADYGSQKYDFTQLRKATDEIGASVRLGQSFRRTARPATFPRSSTSFADGEEHPIVRRSVARAGALAGSNSSASEQTISGVMIDRAYTRGCSRRNDPALRYASQEPSRDSRARICSRTRKHTGAPISPRSPSSATWTPRSA